MAFRRAVYGSRHHNGSCTIELLYVLGMLGIQKSAFESANHCSYLLYGSMSAQTVRKIESIMIVCVYCDSLHVP